MSEQARTENTKKKLSDFFCFALYSAHKAMQRATRPAFTELGITYPQYLVLVTLWEKDGQLVNEIGHILYLESSTLTPVIKKLEAMGLVTRQRDPEDERKVRVKLTARGKRMEARAEPFFGAVKELTGLSDRRFEELQAEIVAVRDRLLEASSSR